MKSLKGISKVTNGYQEALDAAEAIDTEIKLFRKNYIRWLDRKIESETTAKYSSVIKTIIDEELLAA